MGKNKYNYVPIEEKPKFDSIDIEFEKINRIMSFLKANENLILRMMDWEKSKTTTVEPIKKGLKIELEEDIKEN